MTGTTQAPKTSSPGFDIGPKTRLAVITIGVGFTAICLLAVVRVLTGFAPQIIDAKSIAIIIHVAAVVPAVPMGAYVLLSTKGTKLHKMLGKVWLALMLTAACSAYFIRLLNDGSFSWIHIFVPITIIGAWQIFSSARAGKIAKHKKHVLNMFIGALFIPGIASFLPGRLMWVWAFG